MIKKGPALCARCAKQPGSGTAAPRCLPLPWWDSVGSCLPATLSVTARGEPKSAARWCTCAGLLALVMRVGGLPGATCLPLCRGRG